MGPKAFSRWGLERSWGTEGLGPPSLTRPCRLPPSSENPGPSRCLSCSELIKPFPGHPRCRDAGRQDGSSPVSSQTEVLKTKRWESRVLSHPPPTRHCPLPIFGDSRPSLGPCRKGSGLLWVLLTQITPPAPHPLQAHLANLRLLLKASSAPPRSIPQRHLLIFPNAGHHSRPSAPHPWPLRPT